MDDLSSGLENLEINNASELAGEAEEEELCCICRETCVHPVRLPCSHVFCFLCIKGVAVRSKHCALCRKRIPSGFLSKPSMVNKDLMKMTLDQKEVDSFQWYYEARSGGWWLYEKRLSKEIEAAFKENKKSCRVQISGFGYVIDFESNVQFRDDFPNRKRRIKRDRIVKNDVRGIAGIALNGPAEEELQNGEVACPKSEPNGRKGESGV